MSEVRVRFAPSPTGALHIGGVRTALYNYLFAKNHGGQFILRIEDTDENRYVDWAEQYIIDSLKWLNISPDEGPEEGGPSGPYRQSERKHIYRDYVDRLVEEGKAYYAFDTVEELDSMREKLKAAKAKSLSYNAISRTQMKNSLTLPASEVQDRIRSGEPYVVRINIPLKNEIRFQDQIRGWVVVHSSTLDDKILLKSDGMPTYHLANIVDDHLMEITHVIRGEEWLPSAPLHMTLYQYFGWEPPQFAHLPLLLKPDGEGKLSKRDAEKHGFPIFPLEWTEGEKIVHGFRETGYFPEAVLNFIALLGWNPGGEQEVFDQAELIRSFSLDRVNKSGAKFEIDKAKWFNEQYLKNYDQGTLAKRLTAQARENDRELDLTVAGQLVDLLRDRSTFEHELYQNSSFYFERPTNYQQDVAAKKWNTQTAETLKQLADEIEAMEFRSGDEAREVIGNVLERLGVKIGSLMQALRLALTGHGVGPDLMAMISILGGKEVARRVYKAIQALPSDVKV